MTSQDTKQLLYGLGIGLVVGVTITLYCIARKANRSLGRAFGY